MAGRGTGGRKIGHGRVSVPEDRKYGTQAEIDGRDAGTGAHPAATSFKQIGPEDTGGDASNPSFKHLSSDFKFTEGV